MSPKILAIVTPIIILIALVGCGAEPTPTPEQAGTPATTGKIVLADTTSQPAQRIKRWQPLADYLAANLDEFGIGVGEVKIAPDLETMNRWLASGEVDLTCESPYPAMILSSQSGSQPFLRQWKGGDAEYNSIIFARADSDFTSLADLTGQMIALEETYSTTGYMLPLAYLIKAGMKPVEKADADSAVGANEVGYVFSQADTNTIEWVIESKVAAGAVDGQTFQAIQAETRAGLTILVESEMAPRQLVLAQPGMDPALRETIKSLLIALDETAEGQAILEQFHETARFDELPEGTDAALNRMQELYQLIEDQ